MRAYFFDANLAFICTELTTCNHPSTIQAYLTVKKHKTTYIGIFNGFYKAVDLLDPIT